MKLYTIEPRDEWPARAARSGAALDRRDSTTLWTERCCVELSMSDADTLQAHAETLYDEMVHLTDHAIEEQHLSEFDFTIEEKRILARSWEMGDYTPTLCTRLDYLVEPNASPRFLGIRKEFSAGMIETAVTQWDWAVESAPWATQFNTISERLTDAWREYHLAGHTMHFAFNPQDYRDTGIAEYVWHSALAAGINARALPLNGLQLDSKSDTLVDATGEPIEVLVTSHQDTVIAGSTVWHHTDRMNICLVEPHWKRLWHHPQWYRYCERGLRSSSMETTLQSTSEALGNLVCSVWIVAGKVSGVGFSRRAHGTESDVWEFIPHLLVR